MVVQEQLTNYISLLKGRAWPRRCSHQLHRTCFGQDQATSSLLPQLFGRITYWEVREEPIIIIPPKSWQESGNKASQGGSGTAISCTSLQLHFLRLLFPVVVASGIELNEAYEGHLTDHHNLGHFNPLYPNDDYSRHEYRYVNSE